MKPRGIELGDKVIYHECCLCGAARFTGVIRHVRVVCVICETYAKKRQDTRDERRYDALAGLVHDLEIVAAFVRLLELALRPEVETDWSMSAIRDRLRSAPVPQFDAGRVLTDAAEAREVNAEQQLTEIAEAARAWTDVDADRRAAFWDWLYDEDEGYGANFVDVLEAAHRVLELENSVFSPNEVEPTLEPPPEKIPHAFVNGLNSADYCRCVVVRPDWPKMGPMLCGKPRASHAEDAPPGLEPWAKTE